MKKQPLQIAFNKGKYYIEDVAIEDLLSYYKTPLYVYSKAVLDQKIADMHWFLNVYDNVSVAYAAKAFACKRIFKMFEKVGLGIDVVSLGELYTALKAGIDPQKIEFNGNNKTFEELTMAVENGVGLIIVDNECEIKALQTVAESHNAKQVVLLRINPIVEANTHQHIATATKDSKFGVLIDQALDVVVKIIDCPNLIFKGLHFHIGSQLMDNADHLQAIDIVLQFIARLNDLLAIKVDILNIGGGFGVYYKADDVHYHFKSFMAPIMQKIDVFFANRQMIRPRIAIEPGRYMVANAGCTLYKAGTIKPLNQDKLILAVDGGMTDNLRPALYDALYEAEVLNQNGQKQSYSIVGKCCESGDILIKDIEMNRAVKDDIIVVYNTGAYGYSMASNYNRNLIGAVVLIDKGKMTSLIKAQTLQQLIQNDE